MRRIIYTIGEGLLVIALFTAALSAQNATKTRVAEVVVVAPPRMQMDGRVIGHPTRLELNEGFTS